MQMTNIPLFRIRPVLCVILYFWFCSTGPQCRHTTILKCKCNHLTRLTDWKNLKYTKCFCYSCVFEALLNHFSHTEPPPMKDKIKVDKSCKHVIAIPQSGYQTFNKHRKLANNLFFKWATSWQNQRNGRCAWRRLRSAWASAQSDQCLRCAPSG